MAKTKSAEAKPKQFGLGWKKDSPDPRDFSAHALFGAVTRLPADALELANYVLRVNDQGPTSSCVGQAIGKAIHVRLRKIKAAEAPEPAEPSYQAIYTFARRRGLMNENAFLEDDGCIPRMAMFSIRDLGVPGEHTWPFDPATIQKDVPWDVVQEASKFLLFQWYRVTPTGSARSDAVAQALSKGYPVVFGMDLWQGFMDYRGGTLLSPGPDHAGGHMLCILGYRRRADGSREFQVLNSWGSGWGESGYVWLHEDVICSDRADDFYVIQVS